MTGALSEWIYPGIFMQGIPLAGSPFWPLGQAVGTAGTGVFAVGGWGACGSCVAGGGCGADGGFTTGGFAVGIGVGDGRIRGWGGVSFTV